MQETAQRAVTCSQNHWCHDKHLLPLACFASTPACSAREWQFLYATYVSRLPASLLSVALGHQRAGVLVICCTGPSESRRPCCLLHWAIREPASLLSVALGHQRAGFCKQPGLGVPETKLNLGEGGGGGWGGSLVAP